MFWITGIWFWITGILTILIPYNAKEWEAGCSLIQLCIYAKYVCYAECIYVQILAFLCMHQHTQYSNKGVCSRVSLPNSWLLPAEELPQHSGVWWISFPFHALLVLLPQGICSGWWSLKWRMCMAFWTCFCRKLTMRGCLLALPKTSSLLFSILYRQCYCLITFVLKIDWFG